MSGFFARLTGAAPPPPPAAAAAPAAPAAGEENKWWWQRIGDWWAGGTAEGAPDGELPGSTSASTSTSSTSTSASTSSATPSPSTTSTAAPPDSPAKAKVEVSPEDELARVAALLGNPAALAEAGLACAKEEVSSASPSSGSSASASSSAAAPAAAAPNSEVAGRVIFALADLLPLTVVEAAARGEGEGTLLLEEPDDGASDEASTTLPSFVCGGDVTAGRPAVRLQVVRELSPSQQQRASSSPAASPSSGGKSVVTYAVVARLAVPKPDGADAPHRFVVLERELVRRARREDFLRTSLDRRPSPKKAASAAAATAPAGKSEPMETESTTTAATTAAATAATTTKTPATATADSTPAATPPEPPATAALDAEPAAVGVDTTAAATVATRECHACGFTGMTGRFCSKCGAAGKGCSACGFAAATGKFCSRCGGALAAPPSVVVGGQAAKARPNKTLPARAGTAMVLSRPGGSDGAAGGGGAAAAGGGVGTTGGAATARSVFDRAPGSALGTQAPRARPSGPRQVASTRAFGTQQPRAGGGGGAGPGVRRTASARVLTGTDALLQWCVNETDSYDDVDVVNFTRSWKDGRAFAALVDNLTDGALGYRSLTEEEKNDKEGETIMQRAFDVAEDKLGVPKLLDAEDIVVVQDRHSILTYIVTLHKAAHGRMGERGL